MNALATSLLLACIGVLLTWLLRHPARRLTGPGPAFCLWLLPLLLAATPWLPAWPTASASSMPLLVLPAMLVLPQTAAPATHAPVWLYVWLGGCVLMLLRLALYYLHIVHAMRPLPAPMRQALALHLRPRDIARLRLHPAGPAVLWNWRCRVLLPAGFLEHFDAGERTQVLAHEFAHLRRGDPLWSLTAELALAALWFFPPAWLAMPRFRLDQELACDAAVLRSAPAAAGSYARALLGSSQTRAAMPAVNPWLSRPQLKERLTMIHRYRPGPLQRLCGYTGLAGLLTGIALAAQAALPQPGTPAAQADTASIAGEKSASVDMSFQIRHPPRYPEEAIKNHEQGTVVLKVLADIHGKPLKTKIVKSSGHTSLDQAAVNAAMRWRFNPGMRDGKPVKGWARVPVTFSLKPSFVRLNPVPVAIPAHATVTFSLDPSLVLLNPSPGDK